MTSKSVWPSYHMLLVIGTILNAPEDQWWGSKLMEVLSFPSGTLYPLLGYLTEAEILFGKREEGSPQELGRPLRTLYQLTPKGRRYGETYNLVFLANNPLLVSFDSFK